MTNDAPAYVASPPTGTGLPVLLLHTWWGLNQPIQDVADRLAGDGFTVLAPDLFDGTVLTTIEDADAHGQKMDSEYERILGLVGSALDDLLAHPDARGEHAAIVALSFGAWYARQVAEARPQVTALVSIYGDVFEGPEGVAYLGHFAENDEFVNSEVELQAASDRGEAHVYPGTTLVHGGRSTRVRRAAAEPPTRTVEFLAPWQHPGASGPDREQRPVCPVLRASPLRTDE
jgi:carboxymethylenebutenolidase